MIRRGDGAWFDRQYARGGGSQGLDGFAAAQRGTQRWRRTCLLKSLRRADVTGRVLDAGCGPGLLLAELAAARFPRRIGMDLSAEGLARRLSGAAEGWVRGRLPDSPFAAESFDLALCLEMLYYLTPEQQETAVDELRRVVRPGGWILLSARLDDGARYLSRPRLEQLARRAGETVVVIPQRDRWIRPWERRLMQWSALCRYYPAQLQRILQQEEAKTPRQRWLRAAARGIGGEGLRRGVERLGAALEQGVLGLMGWRWPVGLAEGLAGILAPASTLTGMAILCRVASGDGEKKGDGSGGAS
ncbi:MAG: class I SAM-dependent methyltransferase [Magnetococcales bacterium]|nr:class I SAM-dependent methyltransferase [Magnetococcales bacterium]